MSVVWVAHCKVVVAMVTSFILKSVSLSCHYAYSGYNLACWFSGLKLYIDHSQLSTVYAERMIYG